MWLLLAGAMATAESCGGPTLKRPRLGSHPPGAGEPILVPYPPPPARVEIVPPFPSREAAWIDGSWTFRAGAWRWDPGGWVVPPVDTYFAPWTTKRTHDGRLFFFPSAWYASRGNAAIAPPPVLVAAAHGLGETETERWDGGG